MNLEELKKRKLEELQRIQQSEVEEQVRLQQQVEQLEAFAKQYLTKEAISRFGTLKAAHPDIALKVMLFIAQSAQNGTLKGKIDDKIFKDFLKQMQEPKRESKITFR